MFKFGSYRDKAYMLYIEVMLQVTFTYVNSIFKLLSEMVQEYVS